jgi:hypothetical protein
MIFWFSEEMADFISMISFLGLDDFGGWPKPLMLATGKRGYAGISLMTGTLNTFPAEVGALKKSLPPEGALELSLVS